MITIIDYGMGNLGSIANMIKYLGYESEVTSDITKIESAEKLILPGVGHFDKAMKNINSLGLYDVIINKSLNTQMLGICLGMQIMCNSSEEGKEKGLGLIDAEVIKFNFIENHKLKIPHMGWNLIKVIKDDKLFEEMKSEPRFYFVHSYYVQCKNNEDVLTTSNYGINFHSAFARNNIYGVQFHPEKSHKFGMKIFDNFARL